MRLRALLRSVPWLALLTVLLVGVDAFGRAGGGQHYSGGSHSSGGGWSSHGTGGGGGGDGGALFELIYWVIRLTFMYPYVMLPIWAVIIFMIVRSSRQRGTVTTPREIRRIEARRLEPRQDVNAALTQLTSSDPSFDVDAFFDRTRKVFLDIQEAWFLRNLDSVRVYMSDGLYRRFTTLLSLMQLENQRNGLADAKVISARLLEVTSTAAFDCLTVRIHASMKDVDVPASYSDEQTRKAAQRASADEFTEIWTFIRRRGAQTKPGQDVSQGKCPNCGAPFTGGAANKCEYCGAIVNSGNYDWVLSEITQLSEYLPHDDTAPGFENLRAKDPDAAAELLRDRGLLLFWKWLEAWAFADASRMQKLATANGLALIEGEINQAKGRGDNIIVRLAAVGGTSVAAVETDVDGYDRVHIDVRWSAVMATSKSGAQREPRPYRSIVTMVRAASARTDRGTGLSNERCGNCGAPLTNSDSSRCDYCGHDLAAASKEWQLESLVPIELWERPTTARLRTSNTAFATGSERRRLMQVMVAIVRADGVVDNSELKLLRDCAARWQIPWNDVETMLSGDADALLNDLRPQAPAQAREFIHQLIAAAKVDGRIDRRERNLIYRAGMKLQLDTSTVDELLARA